MSAQASIETIKKILSENRLLSDSEQSNFLNILTNAQSVVSEGFEDTDNPDISNVKFYKYAFNLINTEFDTLIKSIENTRSSYLPSDVFNSIKPNSDDPDADEKIIQEISNESTPLESYQNAFFRMLGLPSWEDVEENTEGQSLSIVDSGGTLKDGTVDSLNIYNFLDRRQEFSTIGCSSSIGYFDLVSENISSEDFLKKNYSFSVEAIAEVIAFSAILSRLVADVLTEEDKKKLEEQFILYRNKLTSTTINGETLYDKVSEIYKKDPSGGDPISWIKLNPSEFYDNNSTELNYKGYLLFIYYAFVKSDPSSFLTSPDINKIYKDLILHEASESSLNNIEENIFVYSSLLFPLVKDGRISKCINNPEKIVADPFLPVTKRMVNGKFLKSSLLESIIRIRTDVISGTKNYIDQSVPYIIGSDDTKEIEQKTVSGELLGYLESLLIVRMLDALDALANGTKSNIEQISVAQRRTGKGLFGSCYDPKGYTLAAVPVVNRDISPQRTTLNNYALIEDSIMLLLGTKDVDQDVLSLQTDINRNSSVPSSYLMSSLVSLVQVPRKYINQIIDDDDRKTKTQNSVASRVARDLEIIIGIRSGVGIVDFLAIIIAMLTIDEVYLVSLLTDSQINMMYLQVNPDTFDEDKKRRISEIPMAEAVNVLTERVHVIYQLFVGLLKS